MVKSDVYFEAAKTIEERGHTKYILQNHTGAVCLWGAINYAMTGSATKQPCFDETLEIAKSLHNIVSDNGTEKYDTIHELVRWNNAPERTPTEVIDVLNHTGKMVKELEDAQAM